MNIDLACGNNKKEGCIGVDIYPGPQVDIVHNLLTFPYPFEDNSADHIHCSHFIEHIPHTDPLADMQILLKDCTSFEEYKQKCIEYKPVDKFILFLNEVYRILKPGGTATFIAPYYTSSRMYGDPTHVRPIAETSFWYISKKWRELNKLEHYGLVCDFDAKISYYVPEEWTLKAEPVRNQAILHQWNVVEDIIIDLTKK